MIGQFAYDFIVTIKIIFVALTTDTRDNRGTKSHRHDIKTITKFFLND